ncbi:L-threonylcarbamoyladenylate synthase [Nocardioides coralli]|uniref:L-threonylcarbamoyladenylate synthase n=1 Tax=Nocardioides coralli TaxID=2872154 RepID=UPI002017C125|nr:L-threonylcarbamoyladenylate synthase [Nocardioides coralli]
MTAQRLPTGTDEEREDAIAAASRAVQHGELVVIPTDTVYGIGADAFDVDAVSALLDAKGRGRDMPPPVLVSAATTVDALATDLPGYARALIDAFWPGPLTLVCRQQPSLQWDLGETRGTVAVRMPDHDVALAVLERTGPLAVSSANKTGKPAAVDAEAAEEMLGLEVAVIVDAGTAPGGEASTIVDVTGSQGRVLRRGALSLERLNEVLEPLGATLTEEE